MSWDGSPQGWRPPAEVDAAAEAADKLVAERAAADARTRELANAIAFGFERVALAIVAAAGGDAQRRYDRMNDDEPEAFDPQPAPTVSAMRRLMHEHDAAVADADGGHDPDLDELLSDVAEPDDAD